MPIITLGQEYTLYFVLAAVLSAAIAYFCGCFNGAVIVSKYILRDDIRTHGSGNAGLTNFHRTFGGPLTLVVILLDVVKAVLAILAGVWLVHCFFGYGEGVWGLVLLNKYWAACFCLLGHMFPVMFGFKGGKGILSGGTIAIMLDWRLALLVWGGFILLVALTRYVSLGSVFAAAAFPVGTWLFVIRDPIIMAMAIFLGVLIIWMHRANIKRLLKGQENKLSFHKKKEGGQ